MKLRPLLLLGILLASCVRQRASQVPPVPHGGVGTLVVLVADTTGSPRNGANAYLTEDPHVTSDVVLEGKAGAWSDEKGVARLGAWRPGKYTLVVRSIGYFQEMRSILLSAGRADTVRVVLRQSNMTLQTPITTSAPSDKPVRLGPERGSPLPLGTRLAIQFNNEPVIIQVSDGHGGPLITYRGQVLTYDQIKGIYVLKAKEARDRYGDQTLAGAILVELK
jgi:hypothetical protein